MSAPDVRTPARAGAAAAALLAGLDPDQADAVASPADVLAILAGAGSGKTRVLTRRIAHRVHTGAADPRHVLAITFTRRAATELGARLRALGLHDGCVAGTFHATAHAMLRQAWLDRGRTPPELLVQPARVLGPLVSERVERRRGPAAAVAEVAAEIAWARATLVMPDGYEAAAARAGRRPGLPLGVVAELYARYQAAKRRKHLVDFDDLLALATATMEQDRRFAEAQRWRVRHLFVDEFQDVNPQQLALLRAWRGTTGDLCVVGDPDQAIYGWNGSDPTVLPRFSEHFPGATVIRLRDSYRSTPQILLSAHAALATTPGAGPPLRPQRPDGALPAVWRFDDDRAEAEGIARLLRDRRGPGRGWASMAVLARTNAVAGVIAAALGRAAIPHRVRGGGTLLDAPDVRAWLRDAAAAPTPAALARALGDLDELLAELGDRAGGAPAGGDDDEAVGPGSAPGPPADGPAARLATLGTLGREFLRIEPDGTGPAFAAWLRTNLGDEGPAGGDVVDVATFHAAKGLEWPVVAVAGLEQGLVPMAQAAPEARAEEVRLLYVAMTRARDELHLTWAASRRVGDRVVPRQRSELLDAVDHAAVALRERARPAEWRSRLHEARAQLHVAPPAPAPLSAAAPVERRRARLLQWRATAARAARVPEAVVLDDATLAALARAAPRTRQALSEVAGMTPARLHALGPAVLRALRDAPSDGP